MKRFELNGGDFGNKNDQNKGVVCEGGEWGGVSVTGRRREEEEKMRAELVSTLSYMGFNGGSIKNYLYTFSVVPVQSP
ncbi:hypothetical protein TorRG33x02_106260 [Trema orientale]|uniref:Uncharacterized protein n=1 Tax=Trema orientale TaxID=63057 RepID=A0A2P5F766_TREOI|nr:hypothetical protein TorRG33x02_106260 [Trema orientale]